VAQLNQPQNLSCNCLLDLNHSHSNQVSRPSELLQHDAYTVARGAEPMTSLNRTATKTVETQIHNQRRLKKILVTVSLNLWVKKKRMYVHVCGFLYSESGKGQFLSSAAVWGEVFWCSFWSTLSTIHKNT